MRCRDALAVFLAIGLCGLAGHGAAAVPDSAEASAFAAAIERRADASSFADLERFADEASRTPGREALKRIEYVSMEMLNQSEFGRFRRWNDLLRRKAHAERDRRYLDIAEMDALKSRYDAGDGAAHEALARLTGSEGDWFAKVHGLTLTATMLEDEDRIGAALELLFKAAELVPPDDRDAKAAQSDIWEAVGLGLISLNDLGGSAKALRKAEFEFADPSYPRPDFDGVYNMTHMAVRLGDASLALHLAAIHHRLTARSDLPHLRVWDQNLCAMVAESFGAPVEVSRCLKDLDPGLTGAGFLAPRLLPMRAIAEARQGEIAAARADLDRIRRLQVASGFAAAQFNREPEVEAEILAAEGHEAAAFRLLRGYGLARAQNDARRSSIGVRQLTSELERQLAEVKRRANLEADVVRAQRWGGLFAFLLVMGAIAALIWQRGAARRLRAAQLKAELSSRAKSEFLANMSHEIRTPLNGVVGVADMLTASSLPERERRMAEIIRSSGQTLERLLSDVLDLARVEAGQLTIEEAPFHAGELVRAVAALCKMRAEEKGLLLLTDIAPALEGWFVGDAVRVRQILTNLVSNAVKFTERGSVSIRAEATGPGRLRFVVTDTGVGFEAAQKERLFGRFQQADGSITRRFGGSGLGLAICRQLAALMGGSIDCDSQPGEGSAFWFEAPFPPAAAPGEAAAEAAGPAGPELADTPVRILVADDHATNQTVVRMMLEQFGHEVVVVGNGAEAVDAMSDGRFDAVLMDMQMPVMGGLEATREIRRREVAAGRARTPILMLSANAMAEHREAGLATGADGYVSKPVTVAGLMMALNGLLASAAGPAPAAPTALRAS